MAGHVNLDGSHTTVIEGTESLLKAIHKDPLFDQVRPGIYKPARGGSGQKMLTITRPDPVTFRNTLDLTFRSSGTVSHVKVTVPDVDRNLPAAIARIEELAQNHWRGARVIDNTARTSNHSD